MNAADITHGIHVLVPDLDGYEIATLCPKIERAITYVEEFLHLTCVIIGLLLWFLALYLFSVNHDSPLGNSLTEHLEIGSSNFYPDIRTLLDQGL